MEQIETRPISYALLSAGLGIIALVIAIIGTVDYFAARLLNYPNVSVYDGAWIEWNKRNYPVEGGSAAIQKTKMKKKKARPAVPEEGC